MELNEKTTSPVQRMFQGRSVFITGASGFIGKVLLEKLLRCYPGIQKIYLLMRPKRNQQPEDRLHNQVLKTPIFDALRARPDASEIFHKLVIVPGDIELPRLGISQQDWDMLLQDPSLGLVFHSAATVKFDEPIKTSIQLNVAATQTILDLCHQLGPRLVALCHVSTAYVNSDITDGQLIEERLYPIREKPKQLLEMSKCMDESLMQNLKLALVDRKPNTYTYTKALGEHLIFQEASNMPAAIVRPSIVVGSWKQPIPGWIDNINGPTGLILAIGKGLLRSMLTYDIKAEIIPVDIVVNTLIAASFYVANQHNRIQYVDSSNFEQRQEAIEPNDNIKLFSTEPEVLEKNHFRSSDAETGEKKPQLDQAKGVKAKLEPIIVHSTSGEINPLTWIGMQSDNFFGIIRKYPSQQVFRYPFGSFKSNRYHDLIARIFAHYLPALIIDMLCSMIGKRPQVMSIYRKLDVAVNALLPFRTVNYNFSSRNIKLLEQSLKDERDKQDLFLDISSLNWMKFFDCYILGARRFVLKEPDETLEQSRKSLNRAFYIEMILRAFLVVIFGFCLVPILTRFSLVRNALKYW